MKLGATFSIAASYSFGSYVHFVLIVLLGNQCVPSVRPTNSVHWNDNVEGCGALFDGWRGAITSVDTFSGGWTVILIAKLEASCGCDG